MALVIDNPETERLVEEPARKTGHTPAEAIAEAIREKLGGTDGPAAEFEQERIRIAKASIRKIQERIAALPDLDSRSADEMLYDEHGLPH